MPSRPTLASLADLAAEQWGLVTRQQALEAGVSASTWERLVSDDDILERVARGVYRFMLVPPMDNMGLRAAWLQLEPAIPAWERQPTQGVVSHRSAAAILGLGHLPADTHEFTLEERKQTRRADVRVHRGTAQTRDWVRTDGIYVARPAKTASDLLSDHEDPESVGQVIVDAIRSGKERPGEVARQIGRHAFRFGLRRGDGIQLLHWLLELTGVPQRDQWMAEARAAEGTSGSDGPAW